jgi:hypothetical protein
LVFLGNAAWVRASVVRCATRVFWDSIWPAGLFGGFVRTFESSSDSFCNLICRVC